MTGISSQLAGSTISSQLDLSAREHEPRNAHGEWTSTGGGLAKDALAAASKSGVKSETRLASSGSGNSVSRVDFNDGSSWVKKTYARPGMAERERSASLVAGAVGVKAPAVAVKDGDAWYPYVNGKPLSETGETVDGLAFSGTPEERDAARRLGVLDYITQNVDRHPGNVMRDDGGDLVSMDHEATWLDWGATTAAMRTAYVKPGDFTAAELSEMQKKVAALKNELGPERYQVTSGRLNDWIANGNPESPKPAATASTITALTGAEPVTAEVILAEWYESTDGPAGPHLNRAAAALHAGDRIGAAGELELAAACHGDGETGDRLCRMAISLARTGGQVEMAAGAWRHEHRGAHGEWSKAGGDPSGWGVFRHDAEPGMQLKYGHLWPGEDKQYPEHEFHVGQLIPTQRRDKHERPGPGEPGDPFVITSGDKHYLIDGHHRAAAAGPGGRIVAQHLDLDFPEDRSGNPVNVDPA